MKKVFIAFCSVVTLGGAALAYDSLRIAPADLYAKNPAGTVCQRLVNGINQPNAAFQKTTTPLSSQIISSGGTQYTLWDNAACSTAGGGSQVAFL